MFHDIKTVTKIFSLFIQINNSKSELGPLFSTNCQFNQIIGLTNLLLAK